MVASLLDFAHRVAQGDAFANQGMLEDPMESVYDQHNARLVRCFKLVFYNIYSKCEVTLYVLCCRPKAKYHNFIFALSDLDSLWYVSVPSIILYTTFESPTFLLPSKTSITFRLIVYLRPLQVKTSSRSCATS